MSSIVPKTKHLPMDDNFFKKVDEELAKQELKPDHEFLSLQQVNDIEFPAEQYIVQGLIPKDGITCIGGLPATMKSYFTNYIATCIVDKKPVLDKYKTESCNILFIDLENKLARIKDRFKRLGVASYENIFFLNSNFLLEDENDLGAVVSFIRDHNIKLTFIDTLVRVHSLEENSASDMNRVYQALKELQRAGSAICFLHHFNKRGSFGDVDIRDQLRGSGDILAMVDSFIGLTRKENFIQVEQAKSRDDGTLPRFLMEVYFDKTQTFFNYAKEVEDQERIRTFIIEDEITQALQAGSTTRPTLVQLLSPRYSQRTIDRALSDLRKKGEIVSYKNGTGSFYSLKRIDMFHKEDE